MKYKTYFDLLDYLPDVMEFLPQGARDTIKEIMMECYKGDGSEADIKEINDILNRHEGWIKLCQSKAEFDCQYEQTRKSAKNVKDLLNKTLNQIQK